VTKCKAVCWVTTSVERIKAAGQRRAVDKRLLSHQSNFMAPNHACVNSPPIVSKSGQCSYSVHTHNVHCHFATKHYIIAYTDKRVVAFVTSKSEHENILVLPPLFKALRAPERSSSPPQHSGCSHWPLQPYSLRRRSWRARTSS
jgi:hypothetical protein